MTPQVVSFALRVYRFWSGVKHQLLFSVFGYSSHCKHDPTCSRYLEKELQTHGTIVGLWRGLKRILTCW